MGVGSRSFFEVQRGGRAYRLFESWLSSEVWRRSRRIFWDCMDYEKCRDGEDFVALGWLGESGMLKSSSFWLCELALNGRRGVCMPVKAITSLCLPSQRCTKLFPLPWGAQDGLSSSLTVT